jgi:hypothetical protein
MPYKSTAKSNSEEKVFRNLLAESAVLRNFLAESADRKN